jgi:phosphoglycerol transferase MdoB-like AlkP superfamily enzyme
VKDRKIITDYYSIKSAIWKDYASLILAGYIIAIIMRIIETFLLSYYYGPDLFIIISEVAGLGYDILFSGVLFFIFYPAYYFIRFYNKKIIQLLFTVSTVFICIIHFIILKYFLYQLDPLDIFLYQYSIREILYTLKTSDTNILANLALLIFLIFTLVITINLVFKQAPSNRIKRFLLIITLCSLPLYILINIFYYDSMNKYSLNKTVYFFAESCKFISKPDKSDTYTNNDFESFCELYPSKEFTGSEYPLLYKSEQDNLLGEYFEKFDYPPNIVILIIEGLNDDFVHEYKGALIMPFLNALKSSGLYWEKCFTVGERSFAVVPSILGGLPYGEKGFTLLENLPRHFSLVSILNSNDYQTSFFYGQAVWFHKKDRFFKYNDIDLIVDNSKFSGKYSKIIVGEDNFFWGYNDKDLFSQSFEVIDTLNKSKRLDIYFSGTSHSPFMINDEEYYSSKLKSLIPEGKENFFNSHSKYLKSLLFVDDALKDFFEKYKNREEYKNTIFIITGDHPMTEIPIANSLKRYHVPLIIFSDKLKKHETFRNVVSHLDIPGTILTFLRDYNEIIPNVSTSLGDNLISLNLSQSKRFAFMNDNREIVDYYSNGYYLSEDILYKVDSSLAIKEITNNSLKSSLLNELNIFKIINLYSCLNDKIISNDTYLKELNRLNIYSFESDDTINVNSEYYDLTQQDIIIPDAEIYFDVSFKYSAPSNDKLSVVYQITNSENNNILWKNFGLNKGKNIFREHIKIDKQLSNDSILYFKSFLWNKNSIEITVSDVEIFLHRAKSTG